MDGQLSRYTYEQFLEIGDLLTEVSGLGSGNDRRGIIFDP